MIYLDNSATSYPKPESVLNNISKIMSNYGANSGRGSYEMGIETSEKIYETRKKTASFFNIKKSENVIFTYNCTASLNIAIKGVAKQGCHFIISNYEHNAVVRPLEEMKQRGYCDYSIANIEDDTYFTLKNFERCIRKNTVAIICTGASNVFGIIPPFKSIAALAHKYNLLFILDYSQLAGIMPLDLSDKKIDIVCCSAHKGLLGLPGVGLLIINNDIALNTIIEGGTGSNSENLLQPTEYPDRLESGTPNILGIISLSDSIDFIKNRDVYSHEICLLKYLQRNLNSNKNIKFYTNLLSGKMQAPVLSLNVNNLHSEQTALLLSNDGICVRAGLHCAPLAHKSRNTLKTGTVRISPSIFTEKNDIDYLINSLIKIAK
ncbi:MAG: aminotransferase class V-fold PLP-dependent enzyme [Clostridia bacterium]|nr:aminotransferase class V-fold PLP-dependent enzyme [Clostridia bacterium]